MPVLDTLEKRKKRGAFYTPKILADWLAQWAIRSPHTTVLEPSCGDGVFLQAATQRLLTLGATPEKLVQQIQGIELEPREANRACIRLYSNLSSLSHEVVNSQDFFTWYYDNTSWYAENTRKFDVILGNPPYFKNAKNSALKNLEFGSFKNIWMNFVAASVRLLNLEGKLAFVLPIELLTGYEQRLRTLLVNNFKNIYIIYCNERLFENTEQKVVLLLAEHKISESRKNICNFSMTNSTMLQLKTQTLEKLFINSQKLKFENSGAWPRNFLNNKESQFIAELYNFEKIAKLSDFAKIKANVSTGQDSFFMLNRQQVETHKLQEYVVPAILGPSSLKGAVFSDQNWETLAQTGKAVYLFNIKLEQKISDACRAYIQFGEKQGFHKNSGCASRKPWYFIKSLQLGQAFIFDNVYNFPRIVFNDSKIVSLSNLYSIDFNCNPKPVIENSYSWLTAVSAEIQGRGISGYALKLKTLVVKKLAMPKNLLAALPLQEVDRLIRLKQLNTVLEENSRLILQNNLGLSKKDCLFLRDIWLKLREFRWS